MENENSSIQQEPKKKKCKFCGAIVPANAQKCQHCGEWLVKRLGKPWKNTMLLNFFLGVFGAHRFYTGYIGIGIAQLLTFGGFLIWSTIDFYAIALNKFKDVENRPLRKYNQTAGIILTVVVVLCSLSILGRMLNSDSDSSQQSYTQAQTKANESTPTTNKRKAELEVLEHSMCYNDYAQYICGTIINNTNRNISYAQVDINLYDRDNTLVDNTFDSITDLEANGKWKFKAPILYEYGVASYKIKDVTGF